MNKISIKNLYNFLTEFLFLGIIPSIYTCCICGLILYSKTPFRYIYLNVIKKKLKVIYLNIYIQAVIHHVFLSHLIILMLYLTNFLLSTNGVVPLKIKLSLATIMIYCLVYIFRDDITKFILSFTKKSIYKHFNYTIAAVIFCIFYKQNVVYCAGPDDYEPLYTMTEENRKNPPSSIEDIRTGELLPVSKELNEFRNRLYENTIGHLWSQESKSQKIDEPFIRKTIFDNIKSSKHLAEVLKKKSTGDYSTQQVLANMDAETFNSLNDHDLPCRVTREIATTMLIVTNHPESIDPPLQFDYTIGKRLILKQVNDYDDPKKATNEFFMQEYVYPLKKKRAAFTATAFVDPSSTPNNNYPGASYNNHGFNNAFPTDTDTYSNPIELSKINTVPYYASGFGNNSPAIHYNTANAPYNFPNVSYSYPNKPYNPIDRTGYFPNQQYNLFAQSYNPTISSPYPHDVTSNSSYNFATNNPHNIPNNSPYGAMNSNPYTFTSNDAHNFTNNNFHSVTNNSSSDVANNYPVTNNYPVNINNPSIRANQTPNTTQQEPVIYYHVFDT